MTALAEPHVITRCPCGFLDYHTTARCARCGEPPQEYVPEAEFDRIAAERDELARENAMLKDSVNAGADKLRAIASHRTQLESEVALYRSALDAILAPHGQDVSDRIRDIAESALNGGEDRG